MKDKTKLRVDTSDPRRAVAHISGRLDLAGTGTIEPALAETLAGHTHVAVDLSRVDYISPVGLRLLILAERTSTRHGRFEIVNPQPQVAQILFASGFGAIQHLHVVPQPARGLNHDSILVA
jgi:anti-anti-sigma factor